MNLTQLNERLDQIESEVIRVRNGRMAQLLSEVEEIRQRVAAFIGAAPKPDESTDAAQIVPLALLEKSAILHAVSVSRDREAAATLLGIGRTTLYRKLKEYGREEVRA